jgi:hypothetical protein
LPAPSTDTRFPTGSIATSESSKRYSREWASSIQIAGSLGSTAASAQTAGGT